jgi:hypothetical protein
MGMDETVRRRWFGALVLAGAIGMLVAGETVLKGILLGKAFWVYWLVCFFLTGLAMLVAFRDARAMLQRTGREQRNLLENTLDQIKSDAQRRRKAGENVGRNGRR